MRDFTLEHVLALANGDVALVNLLCATGLDGAENLDIPYCLETLEAWTRIVGRYAASCYSANLRDPSGYSDQKGFFYFLAMTTVLKHPRGLGVSYQPTAIGNDDFSDSRDDLLHGVLTRKLGTCASLPE